MIFFDLIGALTAKPYAFSARPWELERITSVDFFDSLGVEIYVEFFGLELKRILPKINKVLNFDWITDRIRFFYDALIMQKINTCFINLYNKYKPFNWFGVYLYIKYIKIFNIKNNIINSFFLYYYLNFTVDLYSLILLNQYFLIFNSFNFITISFYDFTNLNIDYLNNFFFYKTFNVDLYLYKYLFLFGYNIRCEHPLLFIKFYDLVRKKKLKVFSFGSLFLFQTSLIKGIGLSFYDLYKFFFFKFKFFFTSLFIIGSGFLANVNFMVYDNFFKKISMIFFKFKIQVKFIYLFFYLLDLNLIFLGLKVDFRNIFKNQFIFKKFDIIDNFNFFFI